MFYLGRKFVYSCTLVIKFIYIFKVKKEMKIKKYFGLGKCVEREIAVVKTRTKLYIFLCLKLNFFFLMYAI